MIAVSSYIGKEPWELVTVNAVFGRSTRIGSLLAETDISLPDWWNACWPVHSKILSIVRPRVILTLGYGDKTSAFGLLRRQAGWPRTTDAGLGRKDGRKFQTSIRLEDGTQISPTVVGIPHPSYRPPSPLLSEWLRQFAD